MFLLKTKTPDERCSTSNSISSVEYFPTHDKEVHHADNREYGARSSSGKGYDSEHSNDAYFHHLPVVSLPPREPDRLKKRQKRQRNRLNPRTNRLSDEVKRYNQYQNIWEDIYDEQNVVTISRGVETYTQSPRNKREDCFVGPLPEVKNSDELKADNVDTAEASIIPAVGSSRCNSIIQAVLNEDIIALEDALQGDLKDLNDPIDQSGWTALHFAVRCANIELCRTLLKYRPDMKIADAAEQWTPLHVAAMTPEMTPEIMQLLLQFSQEQQVIDLRDSHGRNALHLCILSICDELSRKELSHLVDAGVADGFHCSLLNRNWSVQDANKGYTIPDNHNDKESPSEWNDTQEHWEDPHSDNFAGRISESNEETEYTSQEESSGSHLTSSPKTSKELHLDLDFLGDNSSGDDCNGSYPQNTVLYSLPEEPSPTHRTSTAVCTFQMSNAPALEREIFVQEMDSSSSLEDCVAVLEVFDLSPSEDTPGRSTIDNTGNAQVGREKHGSHYNPDVRTIVKLFLEKGININSVDSEGNSALNYAAAIGSVELVKDLLDAGSNISTNKVLQTPLHTACLYGEEHVIKILVEHGASLHTKDVFDQNPADVFILEHVMEKNELITPSLRSKYHNLSTALEVMEYLLVKGAKLTNLMTLNQLIENIPPDKFEELLLKHHGTFIMNSTNYQNENLLHLASMKTYEPCMFGRIAMNCRFLVNSDVGVNDQDVNGRTAMHLACWKRNKIMVDTLLTLGAKIDVQDKHNQSCLHYATMEQMETVPNWYNFSGLHAAIQQINDPDYSKKCFENQKDIIKLLLQRGLEIESQDTFGRTPLHRAVESSHHSIVQLLLDQKADLQQPDANGLTAMTYIVKLHRRELYQLVCTDMNTKAGRKANMGRCKDFPPFRKPHIPALEEQDREEHIDTIIEEARNLTGDLDKFTKTLLTTPGIGHVKLEGEVADIRCELFTLMQRLSDALVDSDPRMASSVHIGGSVRENTRTGLPNRFKYLFELTHIQKFLTMTEMLPYSMLLLKKELPAEIFETGSVESFCDSKGIIHGSPLCLALSAAVMKELSHQHIWKDLHFTWEEDTEVGASLITFPLVLQVRWMGPKYRDMLIDVEIVPVVKLQKQTTSYKPKLAWNSQTSQTTIMIKWDGSTDDSQLWNSFTDTTSQIFHNLPSYVCDGYRLAKIIGSCELWCQFSPPVQSHFLKTILFWLLYPQGVVIRQPNISWIRSNTNTTAEMENTGNYTAARHVAEQLFDRLENHANSMYLSSFFMKGQNMFEMYSVNDLDCQSLACACHVAKCLLIE